MRELLQFALLAAQAVAAAQPAPPQVRPPWRLRCRIAGLAIVVLCILIAGGFILTALWLFLVPLIGPLFTALVIAGLALLKAICIAVALRYWPTASVAAVPSPVPSPLSPAVLLAEAAAVFKANKAPVLFAALLAGAVAGTAKPGHR